MAKTPIGFKNISTTYQVAYQSYDGDMQVRQLGARLWEILPRGGVAIYEKSKKAAIERSRQYEGSVASRRGASRSTGHARILRTSLSGRHLEVRGPAVHLIELPIGAKTKHGDPITQYTPDWARLSQAKIADDVKLEGARQSGHAIEGHVRIAGKRYSAFADGGPDDFVIVVRGYKKKLAG